MTTASAAGDSPGTATLCAMNEAHARELLSRHRERIERSLAELARTDQDDDELSHLDQHPADEATELYDEELAERLRTELAALERAEQRLAKGRYGLSIESGDPIPDARLEAIPWAERTAQEQERYEHRG
jgi:DnaK suppressor protein